ncbi:hypothetical protein Ancab_015111 [Ancistrocladus abbreviatus]
MNRAVEGMPVVQPGLKESISYLRACEQREFEAQQKAVACAQKQASLSISGRTHREGISEMSLKEVAEAFTQQHGLLFKPEPGRSYNGNQIYGFGNLSIIVDCLNQKLFAHSEEE